MKAEEVFMGFPGELAFLLASKICQRNQQPFPLCQCLFLLKNVSVTPERWGELRVLARRGCTLYQEKKGVSNGL